jgi:hypothetical protein
MMGQLMGQLFQANLIRKPLLLTLGFFLSFSFPFFFLLYIYQPQEMSTRDVRKRKKKKGKEGDRIVPIIHLKKPSFSPKWAADETLGHRDTLFPILSARSPRSRIHSSGISTFTARQNASMQKTVKRLFLHAPSETAGMKELSLSRSLPPALRRGEHEITMSKEYFEKGLKKAVRRLGMCISSLNQSS